MVRIIQERHRIYNEWRDGGRTRMFFSGAALCILGVAATLLIYDKEIDGDPSVGIIGFAGASLLVPAAVCILLGFRSTTNEKYEEEDEYEYED